MSLFEIIMLVCFGSAWPLSIWKSYKTKINGSKSIYFLFTVLTGYIAGVVHKIIYNPDPVIFLYIANGCMIIIDICIYKRNQLLAENKR